MSSPSFLENNKEVCKALGQRENQFTFTLICLADTFVQSDVAVVAAVDQLVRQPFVNRRVSGSFARHGGMLKCPGAKHPTLNVCITVCRFG